MKKAICLTLWKSMMLLCVAAYLPTAAAAKLRPEVVFSADQLLEALRGRQINYLHIFSSGNEAVAFANGYINAVATVEARAGRWCGMMTIKPHEVVSQVRDFIMASGADTKNQAADIAVAQALQRLHPCAQTAQKGKRK